MNNIILGFSENENNKIENLLRQMNYVITSKHTSFNEILRMEKELYNPIIITKEKLKDGYIFDFLKYTSKNCEHIVVSNKIQELDEFITKTIYINNPIKRRQINIALNIVTNFNNIKLKGYDLKSSDIDYDYAKNILSTNFNFTEELSHKFIQKRAMNRSVNKNILSDVIIKSLHTV